MTILCFSTEIFNIKIYPKDFDQTYFLNHLSKPKISILNQFIQFTIFLLEHSIVDNFQKFQILSISSMGPFLPFFSKIEIDKRIISLWTDFRPNTTMFLPFGSLFHSIHHAIYFVKNPHCRLENVCGICIEFMQFLHF